MSNSHVLLLVAHGSRGQMANDEVRQLTARLSQKLEPGRVKVECAFLELAAPSIPSSIDQAVTRGARRITVLPYFLVAGRHVAVDIPKLVNQKSSEYPDVDIQLSEYLGATDCVDMLSDMVKRAIA